MLAEIKNNLASICKIAANYNIPESTLQNQRDMNKQGVEGLKKRVLWHPGKKSN